jgi:predicted ATPase
MGEPVTALSHLEQGIALYDQQQSHTLAFSRGTDPGLVCLSRAAWALWWLGYPDRAMARSHEAVALGQRLSHPYSLSFALHYNALLYVWCREISVAKELLETSIAFMHEHGFVQFWGGALAKLGWALVEEGSIEEGIAKILQGLDAQKNRGGELGRHENFVILAQAYGRAGQPKEGLRVLADAITLVHHNEELHCEAELYRLKGELLLQSGIEGLEFAEEAESCFHQALTVARRQQAKSLELRAVMSLSRLWQHQGRQVPAHQMLAEIFGWFTEGFDTLDLQEAKALLEALQ